MAGKKATTKGKGNGLANSAVARANMAVGSAKTTGTPRITQTRAGGVRVQNEEWIAAVGGGSTTSFLLGLGPGTSTYGWARSMANNYSKYRVHSFEVSYVSTAGTTVDGSIAIAPFYDATDAANWLAYDGYIELLTNQGAVVGPVYGQTLGGSWGKGSMTCSIDTMIAHAARPWYICSEAQSGNYAQENQCNFAYIGWRLSGTSTSGGVGNIMVRYDIEFLNATLLSGNPAPTPAPRTVDADGEPPEWWTGSSDAWRRLRVGPTRGKPTPKPDPKPDE